MEDIKRKLSKDIDVSTMRSMREQGMTNKQIANALGVAPTTVYRYIGRMSQDVKYAEIQNKPSPIGKAVAAQVEEPKQPSVRVEMPLPTTDFTDAPDVVEEQNTVLPPPEQADLHRAKHHRQRFAPARHQHPIYAARFAMQLYR